MRVIPPQARARATDSKNRALFIGCQRADRVARLRPRIARFSHELVCETRAAGLGFMSDHTKRLHPYHVEPGLSKPAAGPGRH